MSTRILVTGSRDWDDTDEIHRLLGEVWESLGRPADVTLVSGACPTGADQLAEQDAVRRGWRVERHPAHWARYGRRAGYVRNQEMVDAGANVCVAFIKNASRGASMTKGLAERAGIPVVLLATPA